MIVGVSAGQQYNPLMYEHIYDPMFDLSIIPDNVKDEMKRHAMHDQRFPVAVAIILHFITFGIFTLIYVGLKHSKLPLIKLNDFRGGKAIGFMFIPFFSYYWIFMFWVRLANRINFQFRLRGVPAPVPTGLIITTVILGLIPYIGLISSLILIPICLGYIQSACNKLAIID